MVERFITFRYDDDSLLGVLHLPREIVRRLGVLVVVGGPQYRVGSHRQFVMMARALASRGYPVLRFDYRGMGDSTGNRRNFDEIDSDVRAAIDAFLSELPELGGVVIFGLCDAAAAALMYGSRDSRVRGLVLVNPWVRNQSSEASVYLKHYYLRRLGQRSFWRKVIAGEFAVVASVHDLLESIVRARLDGGRSDRGLDFVDRMLNGLVAYEGPVLILMSGRDLVAREFDDLRASHPGWSSNLAAARVDRLDLPEADHTFSSSVVLNHATDKIAAWLDETGCGASLGAI